MLSKLLSIFISLFLFISENIETECNESQLLKLSFANLAGLNWFIPLSSNSLMGYSEHKSNVSFFAIFGFVLFNFIIFFDFEISLLIFIFSSSIYSGVFECSSSTESFNFSCKDFSSLVIGT